MKKRTDYESELEGLIPEVPIDNVKEEVKEELTKRHSLGRLDFMPGQQNDSRRENIPSSIGQNIFKEAEIREGWLEMDRELLGDRDVFYPEDWRFFVKPADVEAIRNWSMIDGDENFNTVDEVFNEILKSCVQIRTNTGILNYGHLNDWDRFFFVLLIRNYTFRRGESTVKFEDECPECGEVVEIELKWDALMFDLPDPSIMQYYDRDNRCWYIDPAEYDVPGDPITFYNPTIEKDAILKKGIIEKVQNSKKVDRVFLKFAQWMTPRFSRDENMQKKQIRDIEMKYKGWNTELFAFFNSVIKNIEVVPSQNIVSTCPKCGEEVTAPIRFQNGIRSLFDIQNRFKKFGTK